MDCSARRSSSTTSGCREDFVPACQDGEVVEHRLVPLDDAGALIANDAGPDVVTADASLVILDCLLRHGAIAPDAPFAANWKRCGTRQAALRARSTPDAVRAGVAYC